MPIADIEVRRKLVETRNVTLNGRRAIIAGWRNAFATVRTLDSDGPQCEFAWETVARVVENGGQFRS